MAVVKDSTIIIFKTAVNYSKPQLIIEADWYVIIGILIIVIIYYLFRKRIRTKFLNAFVDESNFEIHTGLINYSQKIKRNYQNLYIANRIYIELITRKAALPIDRDKDLIKEIYDSWYVLFRTIREEIKNLPGEHLVRNSNSKKLIELTVDILNKGLRPHLTEFQADFKRWYEKEIHKDEHLNTSPQMIQKNYPKYTVLIESMEEVNKTLIQYSNQLKLFIYNSN